MRWFTRTVALCLLILVVTPTRADAWFEWLDRLSGPGSWYGMKADVRAVCWGTVVPPSATSASYRKTLPDVRNALLSGTLLEATDAVTELRTTLEQLRKVNATLNLVGPAQLTDVESDFGRLLPGGKDLRLAILGFRKKPTQEVDAFMLKLQTLEERAFKAFLAIASSGILLDLCPVNVLRSFALEVGLTGLWTGGNATYADNHDIWMSTATVGFSYRVPLPITRDFIDLGTNLITSTSSETFYVAGLREGAERGVPRRRAWSQTSSGRGC